MKVYCTYAEDFQEGEKCPHTGQENCLSPLCPLLETGDSTVCEDDGE